MAEAYFRADAPLTEQQRKWCRCTLHVIAKGRVANPYAVCSKSVGTSVPGGCGRWFNFERIPLEEVIAYAELQGIILPDYPTRQEVLEAIAKWKEQE